jgi:phosphate transport system protein
VRTTEDMLLLVANPLREAATALGMPRGGDQAGVLPRRPRRHAHRHAARAARPPHAGLHHGALRMTANQAQDASPMTDHTTKAFDADLREITGMVAEMGHEVEKQIANLLDALGNRDSDLAQRATAVDTGIDALQHQIEEKAVLIIARRQPMAIDLREIIGAVRIANDLEQMGDLAKNIGKRVVRLSGDLHPANLMLGVERMGELVLGRIRQVLDSYANRDLDPALAVWNGDEEIDSACTSLFRELLTYMMEDPRNITYCLHLMFCAKNIERMGDHATNIAETVYYIIEGRNITEQRPKGDTTSFAAMVAEQR